MKDHYEAVVFDLDGTLLDTLEDLKDSVNAALQAYDCPERSLDEVRSFVGNGIRKLIERCLEGGEEHPKFEKVFHAFQAEYRKNCRNKTKPYDGVIELIRTLKKENLKVAIVSNKADFAVKELNRYYFGEFDLPAIGEKENVRRKPAPDTVFQALKELEVSSGHAIYVGDSDVDLMTAENAGIPCISVLWGFRDREFLEEHHAQYFAKKPEDVLLLLEKLNREAGESVQI